MIDFAHFLLNDGILNQEQYEQVIKTKNETKEKLSKVIVSKKILTKDQLIKKLEDYTKVIG